jgi:hypothetical protein
MMLLVMGGKTATTNPFTIGRANVLFALNLTHENLNVQFSSVQIGEFCIRVQTPSRRPESKLSKY